MIDVPEDVEKIAQQAWGAAQRVGMRIAEFPRENREEAFAIAERALWTAAEKMGMPKDKIEGFIKLQMQAIRTMVENLDLSGRPHGGNA